MNDPAGSALAQSCRYRAPVRTHNARAKHSGRLAGGAGDEGRDDVGGVTVEGLASSVVAHRGSRVGVAGGFLHVAKWYAGVECGGDERVAQGVRTNVLGNPRCSCDAPYDPARAVTVEPPARHPTEQRSFDAFADREINRACDPWCEGQSDDLAALAGRKPEGH